MAYLGPVSPFPNEYTLDQREFDKLKNDLAQTIPVVKNLIAGLNAANVRLTDLERENSQLKKFIKEAYPEHLKREHFRELFYGYANTEKEGKVET